MSILLYRAYSKDLFILCKYLTVSSSTISSGETPPKKMPSKVYGNKCTYKVVIMLLKLCEFNINMGR